MTIPSNNNVFSMNIPYEFNMFSSTKVKFEKDSTTGKYTIIGTNTVSVDLNKHFYDKKAFKIATIVGLVVLGLLSCAMLPTSLVLAKDISENYYGLLGASCVTALGVGIGGGLVLGLFGKRSGVFKLEKEATENFNDCTKDEAILGKIKSKCINKATQKDFGDKYNEHLDRSIQILFNAVQYSTNEETAIIQKRLIAQLIVRELSGDGQKYYLFTESNTVSLYQYVTRQRDAQFNLANLDDKYSIPITQQTN